MTLKQIVLGILGGLALVAVVLVLQFVVQEILMSVLP